LEKPTKNRKTSLPTKLSKAIKSSNKKSQIQIETKMTLLTFEHDSVLRWSLSHTQVSTKIETLKKDFFSFT
jgi:hypothetical protein